MRIERLLIENIASFKGKTEIHFDEISNQSDLFAITGPTGSGKSTILTSISMALYGVHPRGLNSSDIISMGKPQGRIECDFLIKGKKYTAEWTCAVLKKNGEARKTPLITRLLLDENGAIEKTTEDLIGLTFDQFSKVVILNQGQFSTFLTSSFTERKDLLEKLLEHHDLKVLARFLKNKINILEKEKENTLLLTENMKLLQEEEVQEKLNHLKILENKIKESQKFISILETIQNKLKNSLEGEKKSSEIGIKIESVINEADSLSIEVNEKKLPLEEKKKSYLALKGKLKEETPLIELGLELLQKKDQCTHEQKFLIGQWEIESAKNEELNKEILKEKNKITELTNEIEQITKLTKGLGPEFFEKLIFLKRKLKEAQTSLESFKERIHELNSQLKSIQENAEDLKRKELEKTSGFKTLSIETEKLEEEFERLKKEKSESERLQQDLLHKSEIINKTKKEKEKSEEILNKIKQTLKEKKESLKKFERELKEVSESLLKKESSFNKEKLIRDLILNEVERNNHSKECPICDSPLSPKKQKELEEILKSETLSLAEKELVKTQETKKNLEKEIYLQKSQIKENTKTEEIESAELSTKKEYFQSLEQDYLSIESKLRKFQKFKDFNFEEFEKSILDLREIRFSINESRKRWAETNTEIKRTNERLKGIEESYLELKNDFHAHIGENKYLNDQDEETLNNLYKRSQNLVYLQKELLTHSENNTKREREYQNKLKTIKDLNQKVVSLTNEIKIIDQEFKDKKIPSNPKGYKEGIEKEILLKEEAISKEEKLIQELDLSLEKKKTIIRTLKEQLEDQNKLVVFYRSELIFEITLFLQSLKNGDALKNNTEEHPGLLAYFEKVQFHLETKGNKDNISREILSQFSADFLDGILSKERERLTKEKEETIVLQTQLNENEKQKEKIAEKAKELQTIDEQLSRLNFLAPFILKDNFRDFALEVLEDTLLDLANQEIDSLADGRYQLMHGKAGKKSELIVVDHWQSQSKRKVSTLSGGETFLLSLGLALGLSELTRGQTEVECFFIDEGFGTLDEESIAQVLDCLMHIQSRGKQIGLISHVKLLTNQIPVRIELEKNNFGEATLSLN